MALTHNISKAYGTNRRPSANRHKAEATPSFNMTSITVMPAKAVIRSYAIIVALYGMLTIISMPIAKEH
ncbi:MAG: hypothetical protein IJ615_10730 [Bacteroidaceae bacterium]|nr:hypothetical protein [Bacteroidaceae bacterium]